MTTEAFYALPLDEQELQIAKHLKDQERCPKCRGPREACSDPDHAWYPQRSVCYADMGLAAANRRYDLLHKDRPFHDGSFRRWAAEPSADFPVHYRDGVHIWVSPVDLTPDDRFTTDETAPAVAPDRDDEEGGEQDGDEA